jgi:hypothetical protein
MSTKSVHLLLNPLVQQARFVKRLPRRYIGALAIIALLAAFGQLLIQTLLSQQADSGHVISLAANQETLSQRVSKDALAIAVFTDPKNRAFYYDEFTAVAKQWNKVHLGLQMGDANLNLPVNHDPIITQDFQDLEPQYQSILHAAQDVWSFADSYQAEHPDAPFGFDASALVPDVQALMTAEEPFAHGMEKIVARFEELDAEHVTTVRIAEVSLFGATLLVLLIEGLFIFTPAFQALKDNLRSLENSDRRWREHATTLAQRNKQLEEAYEEVWQARSRTLLPVKMVGGQYLVAAGEHVYHVRRGASGSGLVCDCSAGELGYICTHILSASHFQAAQQQRARQSGAAANGGQAWNPTRSGPHEWATGASSPQMPNHSTNGARPEQGPNSNTFEWGRSAQERRQATPPPAYSPLRRQPSVGEWPGQPRTR